MAVSVERDQGDEGKVSSVQLDERVTNPESDLAVQVPEEADASQADALSVHEEPTPNEAAEQEAKEAKKAARAEAKQSESEQNSDES